MRITRENLDSVLSKYLAPGGLLIDLAWNLDTCTIIKWCHDHQVLFVNTSLEVWDSVGEIDTKDPVGKSLYSRQMRLREMTAAWGDTVTSVIDHGANPGLISHFVKQGLIDIAERLIVEKRVDRGRGPSTSKR